MTSLNPVFGIHPVMAEIIVYSKPSCHYCRLAKQELKKRGIQFIEKVVGTDISMGEFFEEIGIEVRTIPQITIDKRLIGGYNELMKYLNKYLEEDNI